MKIRNYTLNFVRLGKPVNNQYPIYLRYFYILNKKKCTYNINCYTSLSIQQFELLKSNKLLNPIGKTLIDKQKEVFQIINGFYYKHNDYPTSETLKEYLTIRNKEFTIKWLIDEFLKSLKDKAKEISLKRYKERLQYMENYINLNPKHFTSHDDIASNRTMQNFRMYLDELSVVKKVISNTSLNNILATNVRFLNFVAKKYDIPQLIYKVKLPVLSEKIHISQSEFENMITYDVTQSGLRSNNISNLKQTQDILYINSLIGLRINELLHVKKQNISFDVDRVIIKFLEQKKNDIRDVMIIDAKAIAIIKEYYHNSNKDYLFTIIILTFNNNLKTLAKLVGMTEQFEYVKNYRNKTITLTKPKYQLISSHSIRRYAVNQNISKYGIDVARQFSGHKSYTTIKNNYMRNINSKDLYERLKASN